jgi:hypothetical protein
MNTKLRRKLGIPKVSRIKVSDELGTKRKEDAPSAMSYDIHLNIARGAYS